MACFAPDLVGLAPFFGEAEYLGVEIDAADRALGTDELTHQKTDITHTTADVQYMHAGANPGCAQHSLGEGLKDLGLFDQPVVFGLRPAEHVVSVFHQSRLSLTKLTIGQIVQSVPSNAKVKGAPLTEFKRS